MNKHLTLFLILTKIATQTTTTTEPLPINNEGYEANVEDFFAAFEDVPGTPKNDHMEDMEMDYFNFEEYNMMVDRVTKKKIKIQTTWFIKNHVSSIPETYAKDVLNHINFIM